MVSIYNLPASGSQEIYVSSSAGTTVPTIDFSRITWNWFESFVEEEDKVVQLRDRKLRYSPFHIRKMTFNKGNQMFIRKPNTLYQIMPKMQKIGERHA